MKNVIIYNQLETSNHGGKRFTDDQLIKYLRCQIDNSLRLGWKPEDIIIGTNFEFSYKDITSHILEDICDWSGFNNKYFGAAELIRRGVIDSKFWLHDHDSWQIDKMEFPEFDGTIAGVEYIGTSEWNGGSLYFSKDSLQDIEFIIKVLTNLKNKEFSSDEVILGLLRRHSSMKERMISINSRWNVGLTHGKLREQLAVKPIIVFSFKPTEPGIYKKLEEFNLSYLLDRDFLTLINSHFDE